MQCHTRPKVAPHRRCSSAHVRGPSTCHFHGIWPTISMALDTGPHLHFPHSGLVLFLVVFAVFGPVGSRNSCTVAQTHSEGAAWGDGMRPGKWISESPVTHLGSQIHPSGVRFPPKLVPKRCQLPLFPRLRGRGVQMSGCTICKHVVFVKRKKNKKTRMLYLGFQNKLGHPFLHRTDQAIMPRTPAQLPQP